MSVMTTSGRWLRTWASSSPALAAVAATSYPASVSSRVSPSRNSAESSARTARVRPGAPGSGPATRSGPARPGGSARIAWQLRGEPGAPPGCAVDAKRAADRGDAVRQPAQARPGLRADPARAVVGDLHPDPAAVLRHRNGGAGGVGVLGDIGQPLGHHEIRRDLHGL